MALVYFFLFLAGVAFLQIVGISLAEAGSGDFSALLWVIGAVSAGVALASAMTLSEPAYDEETSARRERARRRLSIFGLTAFLAFALFIG